MRQIPPADAVHLVQHGALLLDVREPHEWEAGHAADAVHVPMATIPDHLDELPDDRAILVICRSGARSHRVAAFLEHNRLEAHNVAGGMQAWQAAGLQVVADGPGAGRVA